MDTEHLGDELTEQLRTRPYLTLAGVVGLGWMLGRGVPTRLLIAIAGAGARAALATALENNLGRNLGRDRRRGSAR